MTIEVGCRCGKRFMAQPHLVGKHVTCPSCGSPIAITATQRPAPTAPAIVVACQCGQRFSAPTHLAGKRVSCPVCQQPLQVPNPMHVPVQPTYAPPPPQPMPQMHQQQQGYAWNPMPMMPPPMSATPRDQLATTNANNAQQLLGKAYAEESAQQDELNSWGTGKIISGIAMMVGAVIWFVVGLFGGVIFFYPPVLFVFGIIALVNGLAQKMNR